MLTLHYHPLSSFCQKVLIAFYETGVPFTPKLVILRDPVDREAFLKLWPVGKFPVLEDSERGIVPESSIIIEHINRHYPGVAPLMPDDPETALVARAQDRFFDLNLQVPMQKIVTDTFRPEGQRDPFGVEQARASLATAYGLIERRMSGREWAAGADFSIADCAAAPALFYADYQLPLGESLPQTRAYLARLKARPSFARCLKEANPYLHMVPRG